MFPRSIDIGQLQLILGSSKFTNLHVPVTVKLHIKSVRLSFSDVHTERHETRTLVFHLFVLFASSFIFQFFFFPKNLQIAF